MIPEAAVEAAADIVRQAQWGYLTPERAVRYILEAAAPHMLAEAWQAGHSAGDGDCSVMWDADKAGESVKYRDIATPNPYRPAK